MTKGNAAAFYDRLLDQVQGVPGVVAAGFGSMLPFISRGNTAGYRIEGREPVPSDPRDALFRITTNDYLRTLGATAAGRAVARQPGRRRRAAGRRHQQVVRGSLLAGRRGGRQSHCDGQPRRALDDRRSASWPTSTSGAMGWR